MASVKGRIVPLLWIVSLGASVGTGWAAFSRAHAPPVTHAGFLLSVALCVACTALLLARWLSIGPHDRLRDRDRGGGTSPDR
jgi:hypothetical protein